MSTAQWIKEAEEQARKYSDALKTDNQYLIDQLNASKTNALDQLQKQQNNAIYNLNANQSTINKTAEDNAKQANINRLLALKSNESAMNRAGLGTQGIVGSQVNSINNQYGDNLTSILNEKTNQLNELEKQKNNLNTEYDTNRLNLENEYANNIANTQSQIDDRALNQYNTVYQNYLALKQQEYENEQAEKARLEAIRQWEAEQALQKQIADRNYAISMANASRGNSYSFNDGGAEVNTAYYQGSLNPDAKNGTFSNGYQPDNIGGNKLSKTGDTITFDTQTLSGQKQTVTQSIWKTSDGTRYYWDGRYNKYIKLK